MKINPFATLFYILTAELWKKTEEILRRLKKQEIYAVIGNDMNGSLPIAKLLWQKNIKKNDINILKKYFLAVKIILYYN